MTGALMGIRQRLRLANERLLPNRLFSPPETVVLGLNNFCNLYCRMCDVGTGNAETNFGANLVGAKTRMMSFDLYERIARQIADWCPNALLGFVYTEPLAWPHITKAVRLATDLGLRTHVTTNGLLLPRHAEGLVEAGCGILNVSIDGPPKIHDFIRRKEGSYAKAVEGIAKLRAIKGAPPVLISCAITQWNVGHLAALAQEMTALDIQKLFFIHNQFTDSKVADTHNALHPALLATASNVFESDVAAIDLKALSADLQAVARRNDPFEIAIQPGLTDLADLQKYYERPAEYVAGSCTDPFRIIMIDADAEVIPAHGRCFRFPIGNVDETPLSELWNARPLAQLRAELNRAGGLLPACSRCCGGVA